MGVPTNVLRDDLEEPEVPRAGPQSAEVFRAGPQSAEVSRGGPQSAEVFRGGLMAEEHPKCDVSATELSVTEDGAKSFSSNTSESIGHIPVTRNPFAAFWFPATFLYALPKSSAT